MTRELSDGEVVPGTSYRVLGLVGQGGMGSVYEVEHMELGKRFVLKALLPELGGRGDLVARLRTEWRALGRLEHPNIVSVTDAGITADGIPFFVMERLQGETLSARLRRERRLSLGDALAIAMGMLEGLAAAHRIGVVHRDVKPGNVFLAGSLGSAVTVKVLDFGVAKVLGETTAGVTARGVAVGTPRYMSPEQAKGVVVDGRADLYAVGLLLFEMLTGRGPTDEQVDGGELLARRLSVIAPRVSSFVQAVPKELDDVVAALLAIEPGNRPISASVTAERLGGVSKRLDARRAGARLADVGGGDDVTTPSAPAVKRSANAAAAASGGDAAGSAVVGARGGGGARAGNDASAHDVSSVVTAPAPASNAPTAPADYGAPTGDPTTLPRTGATDEATAHLDAVETPDAPTRDDAPPTRTRAPAEDPPNATPPPVVQRSGERATVGGMRRRAPIAAAFIASGLGLLFVALWGAGGGTAKNGGGGSGGPPSVGAPIATMSAEPSASVPPETTAKTAPRPEIVPTVPALPKGAPTPKKKPVAAAVSAPQPKPQGKSRGLPASGL